jgi:transcriptional regulator of acetoin/glycerol metabolism
VELHVISATNRNLGKLVEKGEFREDLYYRLNGLVLHLPALRERKDLRRLIHMFLMQENDGVREFQVEQEALDRLLHYAWPGNIRELRNVLRTAVALSDGNRVRLEDLPQHVREGLFNRDLKHRQTRHQIHPMERDSQTYYTPLETAEREIILSTLKHCRWNVTTTAHKLRLSRSTLYRKAKRLDINLLQP